VVVVTRGPAQQAGDTAATIAEVVSQLATKADLRDLEQWIIIKLGGTIVVAGWCHIGWL